jgi:hypothetical protein
MASTRMCTVSKLRCAAICFWFFFKKTLLTAVGAGSECDWIVSPVLNLLPRLRIGFLSKFFHKHSVSKMITRLITSLPRSLFQVSVFRFAGPEESVVDEIRCVMVPPQVRHTHTLGVPSLP